ncbi:Lacal_2735 family protein [Marinilabilia salmonicolor]|uniref:Lacal_2735 family protein n=1 Tax=Marinilabilia salmonicolor TaxID=989 RepID=UPI00029ACD13
MFNLFKRKSKIEVLNKKYQRLLNEAYKLSTINRKASDEKTAEANLVLRDIELLKADQCG